jgi:anti-anti-sigma regulatory factor
MLLDVHRDLAQRGVDCFLVVEHGSATARLVEVTGLDAVLPTHHRVGDALEAARRCVEHVVPGERTPTR